MEESLPRLRRSLAAFCNRLESSCDALKLSVDRRAVPLGCTLSETIPFRPIRLGNGRELSTTHTLLQYRINFFSVFLVSDSASTTFIQSLNRRAASLSGDLNLLETMSLGAVSFEELLGHCNEVFKKNQSDLVNLQDRLRLLGYVSVDYDIDILQEDCLAGTDPLKFEDAAPELRSTMGNLADDSLLEELTSLQILGLSDASLATIASEGAVRINEMDSDTYISLSRCKGDSLGYADENQEVPKTADAYSTLSVESTSSIIDVSDDDFESLPSYMKSLASWEDLQTAIEKMNSSILKKGNAKETACFHPDEFERMGLGPKWRSFLLLLVRMKCLVVETKDGSISYRVL